MKILPKILVTEESRAVIDELEDVAMEFRHTVLKAV
jgi:hypothetical protein